MPTGNDVGGGNGSGDRWQPLVTVYTLPGCRDCRRARRLLERRGIAYSEVSVTRVPNFRAALLELTGGATVPQILVDLVPIGGADVLARLDRRGVLMARLAGERFPRPALVRRFSARRFARWALTAPFGRDGDPWRYQTELIDRDGRSLGPVPRGPGGPAGSPR
ncbi:MAG: glutaredoxin domain-containing protein [Solirubrobacterales bacterium]